MSSLIPDALHLKSADETQTIDIQIPGGGEQKIITTGSLRLQCPQSLSLQCYDANVQVAGNFGIRSGSLENNIYFLPNPTNQVPENGQVIVFNADRTSSFQTISIPQNVAYNPAQAAQDMATYALNNVADLNLVSPTTPGRVASLIVRDTTTTLSSNQALSVSCAGFDMELIANNIRCRTANGGIFAVFNDSGYYVFPQGVPTVDNSYIKFGANGFSTFEPFPSIPQNVAYNPAQAEQDMAGFAIINASDVSSADYSLQNVGQQSDQNAADIATLQGQVSTLQGQVSTLESKVAALSTVILNAFGIVIP